MAMYLIGMTDMKNNGNLEEKKISFTWGARERLELNNNLIEDVKGMNWAKVESPGDSRLFWETKNERN